MDSKHTLTSVRLMRPPRRLTRMEARRVTERQAAKLLRLRDATEAPIPEEVVTHLPRIEVERSYSLGSLSGVCHWEGNHWRISVNARHAYVRQRFRWPTNSPMSWKRRSAGSPTLSKPKN